METAKLTFKELNDRIDAMPDHPSMSLAPTKRTLWGYFIGFGAGFLAMISAKLLPSSAPMLIFISALVVIEIVALAIATLSNRPWKINGIGAERREYAEQLDFDMPHHVELVAGLRKFPKAQLSAMADYASHRHERLKDKLPLMTGSLEKLGMLPVAVALYLQFKDMHWPPQPTWMEIILGFMLVYAYWTSLLLVSLRFRIQLYEVLLRQALDQPEEISSGADQPRNREGAIPA